MSAAVAIAATSPLAANAGAAIAEAGGNAVDAAIAAMLVSINTEPGVCSLACGGYISLAMPGQAPITLDGYVAAPGRGAPASVAPGNSAEVHLEYGGGITTVVGPDSVGVPGGIALFGEASRRFGKLPWATLFEPAIDAARNGFPLPGASHHYLQYSGEPIFSRAPDGRQALYNTEGELRPAGATIHVPHLADTLARIAARGANEFYTGSIGHAMADFVSAHGGRLSREDLAQYRVIERPSLVVASGDWKIATNPPPAVGGTVLAAMLRMMSIEPVREWNRKSTGKLVAIQRAALAFRRNRLDLSDDIAADARALLELAAAGDPGGVLEAGSTCHTSAVDSSGLACAITMSAGYGAGDMPPGTGIWLNNCLGELELNRRGLGIGPPGVRLPSNMAPTTAQSRSGEIMAIGSPGADRITTAILQTLVNHMHLGMTLTEAVEHPRAHVELVDDDFRVSYESGLPLESLEMKSRKFDELSMYFGGVGAVTWQPQQGFAVAADPRRTGGTWCSRA